MILHFGSPEEFPRNQWRWVNFSPAELACSHCGAVKVDTLAMDHLQDARSQYGAAISIASAYRCPQHPIEAAKSNRRRAGSHTTGSAFDAYPWEMTAENMRAWFDALASQGLHRFGMSPNLLSDGRGQFHVDWDRNKPPGMWWYAPG